MTLHSTLERDAVIIDNEIRLSIVSCFDKFQKQFVKGDAITITNRQLSVAFTYYVEGMTLSSDKTAVLWISKKSILSRPNGIDMEILTTGAEIVYNPSMEFRANDIGQSPAANTTQVVRCDIVGEELRIGLSSTFPMYGKGDVLCIGKDNRQYVVVSTPCQVADFQEFFAMPCKGWVIPAIGDTVCAYSDTLPAVNVAQMGGNDSVYAAIKESDLNTRMAYYNRPRLAPQEPELAPFLSDSPFVINEHIIYVEQ